MTYTRSRKTLYRVTARPIGTRIHIDIDVNSGNKSVGPAKPDPEGASGVTLKIILVGWFKIAAFWFPFNNDSDTLRNIILLLYLRVVRVRKILHPTWINEYIHKINQSIRN